LNILLLSVPIVFLAHNSGAILTTKNLINKKVRYMGIVALLNIVLNLIVIPKYGAIGAASTTVVSNLVLLILYIINVKKNFK
jgi:O-antigen/teichoic acid export membrane protein